MNWKNNLGLKSALFILIVTLSIFLVLASALMMLALYDGYKQQNNDSKEKQEKEQVLQETLIKKESLYLEMSPLDTRKVITYKVSNEPFFKDYMMIVAQEKNNPKEEPLFIGEERIGIPQWLDDDHIIFTSYCGTSCKGIYLIDVRSKEVKLATLSFAFSDTNLWETHFRDWFGKEFQFAGLLGELNIDFTNDNFYLVFSNKEQDSDNFSEKRFLFTGEDLIEQ